MLVIIIILLFLIVAMMLAKDKKENGMSGCFGSIVIGVVILLLFGFIGSCAG